MKFKTRILCVLMLLAMLLGTFSVSISAAFAELRSSLGARTVTQNTTTQTAVDYTQYVDTTYAANGNNTTTMGPVRPSGSIAPNPVSSEKPYAAGFDPNCKYIRGFSQAEMSCGAPRYSNFLLSPQTGLATAINGHDSEYEILTAKPEELSVKLKNYDITASVTPTENSAIYNITYPESSESSIVLEMLNAYAASGGRDIDINIGFDADDNVIIYGGQCNGQNPNLYIYFYAVVDKKASDLIDYGTYYGSEKNSHAVNYHIDKSSTTRVENGAGVYLSFATNANETVKFKVAISFYSPDAAKAYLDAEIPAWDYNAVKTETKRIWNEKFSILTISENSTAEQKRLFYTSFYKCFINPSRRDASDYVYTYYDGKKGAETLKVTEGKHKFAYIENGVEVLEKGYIIDDQLCTWDTFRTTYPFYSLVDPVLMADTVNSYILRLKYNGCVRDMVLGGVERDRNQGGDDTDNVLAEAYLKLKDTEAGELVDWEEAYKVLKDNAENWRDDQSDWGFPTGGVASTYRDLGYIPCDEHYYSNKSDGRLTTSTWIMSCNKTLEYAYNDYCCAMVAKGLSEDESISADKRAEYEKDYTKYLTRSENWKNLWNENAKGAGYYGFIWPKYANGEWFVGGEGAVTPSYGVSTPSKFEDGTSWSGSWNNFFYEGTCYSYSFLVPHDIATLIEMMGGEETFIKRLQTGIDKNYIAIDNQPGFLQAFMFNETTEPWHTTDYVEKVLGKYSSTKTPGADDSGSACAWYIFANMGIFPNAGQSYYYLTSPRYETTTLKTGEGTFTITAENFDTAKNKYIQAVYLNGEPYYSTKIEHADIVKGGELKFVMGSTPVNYAAEPLASGTLFSGHSWTIIQNGSKKILNINMDESSTTSIGNDSEKGPWWDAYADQIDEIVIGNGITAINSCLFSGLTKLTKVTIPKTLTDLSGDAIFEDCTNLTTIAIQGNDAEEGVLDLSRVTEISTVFKKACVGKNITVKLGDLTSFEPKTWFWNTTTVKFAIVANSAADEWVKKVQNGIDDRPEDYKFNFTVTSRTAGGVQTITENGVTTDKYSWTLDTETGVLEFTRHYKLDVQWSWCELTFTNSNTAFADWVVDWKDEIKHIVIPSNFGKFTFEGISTSPFAGLSNLESVQIDIDRWQINGISPFANCPKLTTIGTSKTIETGKIKLGSYKFEGVNNYHKFALFNGCSSVKYVDFMGLKMYSDAGNTQIDLRIDENAFRGCTSLETVKLDGVKTIKSGAFNGCTALSSITIPTTLTNIESNAFADCGNLNVILECTTLTEGLIARDSFPTDIAGVVILCKNNDVRDAVREILGEGNATIAINANASATSGITMEGYSIRYTGYNGLRGIFTFNNQFIAENASEGFTLVEYGAISASEASKNEYTTNLKLVDGEFVTNDSKVVKSAVYKNGKIVNKVLSTDENKTTFAVAITKFSSHYQDDICMIGYSIWQDSQGNYSVKYAECENDDFKSTSIYEVTLGMYKDGFVNAEDDTDGVVWGVLEACAATLTEGTDYRAGDRDLNGSAFGSTFTFKNVVLYNPTKSGSVSSNLVGVNFETWQNGNITVTLLPDGTNYVAVIRGNGSLPGYDSWDSVYLASNLFLKDFNSYKSNGSSTSVLYDNETGEKVGYVGGDGKSYVLNSDTELLATAAHRRQPSPTFTNTGMNKIKTVIFDHGITNIPDLMFYQHKGVNKVIYAETVTSMGMRSFELASNITTFAPVNKPTDENPNPAKPEANLIDLSGFTGGFRKVAFNQALKETTVRVILPKGGSISDSQGGMLSRGMFEGCNSISAISTSKETLVDGVADLRGITYIPDGTGNGSLVSSKITKIYLDDSITTLGTNSIKKGGSETKVFYSNAENSVITKYCGTTFTYKSGYTFEQMLSDN